MIIALLSMLIPETSDPPLGSADGKYTFLQRPTQFYHCYHWLVLKIAAQTTHSLLYTSRFELMEAQSLARRYSIIAIVSNGYSHDISPVSLGSHPGLVSGIEVLLAY